MSEPSFPNPPETAPFRIERRRLDPQPGGVFRPFAVVQITPALRTSGLLLALPPEEVRSLLFVLTFVHPNGHIQPSAIELARAMQVSERTLQKQMRRLERFRWQGKPLLLPLHRQSGLHAFAPSPHLFATSERLPEPEPMQPLVAAGRDAVIAHSRKTYARPRLEVEAEIARVNGWILPPQKSAPEELTPNSAPMSTPPQEPTVSETAETRERTQVRSQLLTLGLSPEQTERLLQAHDIVTLQNQIAWLPYRHANNPGRFLVAAVEGSYEMPLALRRLQPRRETEGSDLPFPGE